MGRPPRGYVKGRQPATFVTGTAASPSTRPHPQIRVLQRGLRTRGLLNYDSARAGLRVGYGGHGLDLQASVDSPRFGSLVRIRADVGHGHWVGINGEEFTPRVTRVAAS